MKELNELANEIVSELVDCGSAEERTVEQYRKWTLQRLEKAFRALEQRAEAAEAKLAEPEKQQPMAYLTWHQGFRAPDDCEDYFVVASEGEKSCDGSYAIPVYARPTPAVSLAELVPVDFPEIRLKKATLWIERILMDKPGMKEAQTVSAILRNVEALNEAKS